MKVYKVFSEQIKGNGVAQLPTPDTTATIAPLFMPRPKKRESLFAREIWRVENRPGFAVSSIYGHAA